FNYIQSFDVVLTDIHCKQLAQLTPADTMRVSKTPGINYRSIFLISSFIKRIARGYPVITIFAIVARGIYADYSTPYPIGYGCHEGLSYFGTASISDANI